MVVNSVHFNHRGRGNRGIRARFNRSGLTTDASRTGWSRDGQESGYPSWGAFENGVSSGSYG